MNQTRLTWRQHRSQAPCCWDAGIELAFPDHLRIRALVVVVDAGEADIVPPAVVATASTRRLRVRTWTICPGVGTAVAPCDKTVPLAISLRVLSPFGRVNIGFDP